MNPVQTWGDAISGSMIDLWVRFIGFLPALIGALIVFFAGLIIAIALGKAARKIINIIKVDQVVEKMKLSEKFKGSGVKLSISRFFEELVKWFLILVFLMASTDILGLNQVTNFLNDVIFYIPNLVVATIILAIAFLLASFVYNVVRHSTRAAGVMSATLLATIAKWAIIIFGLLAALVQLKIAVSLVNTLFIGVVAALSLAAGLAFGLGGKNEAEAILKKLREEISERNHE